MNSILHQQLEYALSSELSINIDSAYSTVAMACEGVDLCFMQGDEAESFIEEVDTLYMNDEFNSSYDDAALICGYPYLDLAN